MHDELWLVILISLKIAFIATTLVMVFSIIFGFFLVNSQKKILKLFEFMIYLPMALPPVALGYGLLLLFGKKSWLGDVLHRYVGIDIAFTFLGAVLSSFLVSLGIGVRTIRVAIEKIDRQQYDVARLMGADRSQIFWYITLPQLKSAIIGGGILVFIRSLSEFGATIVFAGNTLGETRTLALAIWVGMEVPGRERQCLMLMVVAIMISIIALFFAEVFSRGK